MKVILRRATEADAKHAASLLTELGYPSTEADARDRLVRSLRSATSYCLVAELAAEVVGLISAELVFYFPTGSTICRITSLVVSSQHRGHGLGQKLLTAGINFSRASIIARASGSPAPRGALMRTASISGSVFSGRRFDSSKQYDANVKRTFLKFLRPNNGDCTAECPPLASALHMSAFGSWRRQLHTSALIPARFGAFLCEALHNEKSRLTLYF